MHNTEHSVAIERGGRYLKIILMWATKNGHLRLVEQGS